ncbi:hypothetical protein HY989_05450 [Candidatus Micrarchaeota archaeon]|nr:hypothetical protein [Candidatus Micrarchaeota archaeon]
MGNEVGAHPLDMRVVSLSLGGSAAIISALCGIWLLAAPNSATGIFSSLTHYGIDWKIVPVTVGSIVSGAILWFITGAAAGAIFTMLYNACARHCGYK